MLPPSPLTGGRRILRSSPSMVPLSSSLSSLSIYTTTSSKTQWGPGALAGKAILALGKATIRGAERVVIFKRMMVLREHLPCYDEGGAANSFMDRIFDDLLELSRPDLYPDSVRISAMELVLNQIASGHTAYLVNCLSRSWLLDDLILLITEVMFMEPSLVKAFISALPEGRHPLGPCVIFIAELAQQNETTFEAAVLSKFFELLLLSASRKNIGFRRGFNRDEYHNLSSAFAILSAFPKELHELWTITLEQYWPSADSPSLEAVVSHIDKTSPTTWHILQAHFLQREAPKLLQLLTPGKYPMHGGRSVADVAYPQLKDFSLSSVVPVVHLQDAVDSGLAASYALWHFIRCLALGGDVHTLMSDHLVNLSHRDKVSLFSRLSYFLLPNTRESSSSAMRHLCTLIGGREQLNNVLTKFLLGLTHSNQESKYALLDAVIVLVIPLLIPEMKSWAIHEDLFRRSHYFPSLKLEPSYSKATLALFAIIRENMLSSVIGQPGSRISQQIADVLEPLFNAQGPLVTLDYGTFEGAKDGNLTKFLGVPFCPPCRHFCSARFELPRPPLPLPGIQNATVFGPACPQQALPPGLPISFPNYSWVSEECLTLDVFKPTSAFLGSKLPVLVWLYGGGWEIGHSSDTDMRATVERSLVLGEPVIIVTPNYRLNAFGFLAGKEVSDAGITNLGLRDQISALEWVHNHIHEFGGDPDHVVLSGFSAGSVSTGLLQLFNKPASHTLFHGAFMASGSLWATPSVAQGQHDYDNIVTANNCQGARDTLDCLRHVPLEAFLSTVDKTPDLASYRSLDLVWTARVDGDIVLRTPAISVAEGEFSKVIGDVDDEGTLFAFSSTNVTTEAQFRNYAGSIFLPRADPEQVSRVTELYPQEPAQGSPFGTGNANQLLNVWLLRLNHAG
ncbi:Alpha/Beta hydrolase protein [Mycena polygramma]|nr:Alpha/Beta hydrolase protein [Mycena polygramma]